MASSSSSNKLVRVLYRGLLRAAARLDAPAVGGAAPAAVLAAHFPSLVPAGLQPSGSGPGPFTLRDVVRHQFKTSPPKLSLDAGLRALATANKLAAASKTAAATAAAGATQGDAAAARSADGAAAGAFAFVPGQIFRHRVYGYRAVIISADAACRASEQWVAKTGAQSLPHGTAQPFYHCLVDIRDRPEAQVSYVAQDNVELLAAAETGAAAPVDDVPADVERLVLHPLLTRYFSAYAVGAGVYVPGRRQLEAVEGSGSGVAGGDEPHRGGSGAEGKSPRVSTVGA